MLGVALYEVGILVNRDIPTSLQIAQSLIRPTTFVAVGVLVGAFAQVNRRLVAELTQLARRDALTGLPNTRAFEAAIAGRLERGARFAILVGDVDELRRLSGSSRDNSDNALGLYRVADERLYARKVARGYRRGFAQTASIEATPA